jgi:hypothetical protein
MTSTEVKRTFIQLDSRIPQTLKAVQPAKSSNADKGAPVDEDAQIAAERDRYGGGCRRPSDENERTDAERQPVRSRPGAADIDIFPSSFGKRGRHLGIGQSGEQRDGCACEKAHPQIMLRKARRRAQHGIDACADDDADAVKHEFKRT